ncbi:MAG: type III-B CRISPR module RAMP protein Cmr6 [Candidatus Korarchaeota archaeon]|nr:type III-B CRISPR module RAMP protein Cmr6 [Candidatus Korarchaeota archaeon]
MDVRGAPIFPEDVEPESLPHFILRALRELSQAPPSDLPRVRRKLIEELPRFSLRAFETFSDVIRLLLNERRLGLEMVYPIVQTVKVTTRSRLLINTSEPPLSRIFALGLALHPLFGVPYISASALKGVLRHSSKDPPGAPSEEEVFGSKRSVGGLVVTDALPVSHRGTLIVPEVITPTYRTRDRSASSHSEVEAIPTPLIFPAVARGVTFEFHIAARSEDGAIMGEALRRLANAASVGVGAKTTSGFGIFSAEFGEVL